MLRFTGLFVRRNGSAYSLCIRGAEDEQLYYTTDPDAPEDGVDLPPEQGGERLVYLPDVKQRPYFGLRRTGQLAADPSVEIPSVENFRDMGGYLTEQGRVVRWGRFFRCGAIAGLSQPERQVLSGLKLRYVLDYRSQGEVQRTSDELDASTEYYHVPAIGPDHPRLSKLAELNMVDELRRDQSPEHLRHVLESFAMLYRELPFGNPAYQRMIGVLGSLKDGSMAQHCSAGKDRTGMGCALLLTLLGVARETVVQDYMLSRVYRQEATRMYAARIAEMGLAPETNQVILRMLGVSPEWIEGGLAEIERRYGSFAQYFQQEHGLTQSDIEELRQMHTLALPQGSASGGLESHQ